MTADDEILSRLRAVEGLNVHDGDVEVDEAQKVILVELPYVVFYGSPGRDDDERYDGTVAGEMNDFSVMGVGESREQAKWALKRAYTALSRTRLDGGLIEREDRGGFIRREPTYTRAGGEPVFYGTDFYTVPVHA